MGVMRPGRPVAQLFAKDGAWVDGLLARMNDADQARYYIDPKTARVVSRYSRNWVGRRLYTGLHSLNFPWLYNYRRSGTSS